MKRITAAGPKLPRCKYFRQCGICTLQHIEYSQQVAVKTLACRDMISRSLGVDPAIIRDCVPSPEEYAFLASLDLHASVNDSRLTLGLPSQDPNGILPIARCELLPPYAQSLPRSISGALRYLSNAPDALAVQMVRIRTSTIADVELSLWTHPGSFPRQIASSTLVSATGCKGLKRVIFRGDPPDEDIVVVEDLASKSPWAMRVAGHRLQASAVSPVPSNIPAAEAMIECIFELGWLDDRSTVLELYPGVGSFTVPIAEHVKSITPMEPFAYAYHDLVANLARSKSAATPMPGSIVRALPQIPEVDSIIVHSDRSNLNSSDWESIEALGAGSMILLAQDLEALKRTSADITRVGFIPTDVAPFDIRPQTMDTSYIARFLKL